VPILYAYAGMQSDGAACLMQEGTAGIVLLVMLASGISDPAVIQQAFDRR